MSLHPIDKRWNKPSWKKLDEMMVFCILDSHTQYKTVCKAFDALKLAQKELGVARYRLSDYLGGVRVEKIASILRHAGYPYYNQKARYLHRWGRSIYSDTEFLRTASRDEIADKITGIGMKLASMFVRNTRNQRLAVLDTHILKFMGIPKPPRNKSEYHDMENRFLEYAISMKEDPYKLDMKIWNQMRVK